MYLRITKVNKRDKSYRYAQIVESRRRPSDGMVVKKVIANLGALDDVAIENIRLALRATKHGRRVAIASVAALPPAKPDQSLRYLDVAVFVELWRELGLDQILRKLMPQGAAVIPPADVVAALVIHRCVDSGSKLHATRWFPRTALPELLDVPTTALENTRLHRVLDQLDEVTPALMRALPGRYREQDAAFSALFMDVTDASFYGRGPQMAQWGRCKDDVIRRMISILLLCNEHGYPLRWSVTAGNCAETTAMLEQFSQLRHVRWAKDAPIVVDRALGRTSYLQQLLETGVPFLTALVRSEIPSYVDDLPWRAVSVLPLEGERAEQVSALRRCVEAEGFTHVDAKLCVRDLGVIECAAKQPPRPAQPDDPNDRCRFALQCARTIRAAVEDRAASSIAAAGRALGLSKGLTKKYYALINLTERIQMSVLDGAAGGVSLARLIALSRQPPDEQLPEFEALVIQAAERPARAASSSSASSQRYDTGTPVRFRAVAYFNPELFLDQRDKALRKLNRVKTSVRELNAQLASARSRRSRSDVSAAVDRILRKDSLVAAFDVQIDEDDVEGRAVLRATVTLRDEEWARRRAFDGFCVLLARPDCELSPERLCQAYRSKDTVETDFRVIKSCVKLHPVWHHNDAKVRAHVALCMLALLLERTLRRKLGETMTSEIAAEHLADCRLNRYADSEKHSAYLITQPDSTQMTVLRTLGLEHLADDEQMTDAIWPR
jgi:transposase